MKNIKVMVANPPWIIGNNFTDRRVGVRAGSRWPFTYEANFFSILINKIKNRSVQTDDGINWWKNNFKRNPIKTSVDLVDTIFNKRRYVPYPGFMGYAVSYLRSQNIETEYYDAIAQGHSYERFFKEMDNFKPKIIIQETSTPSFEVDIELSKKLHENGCEVCLVGPHATAFAEKLIKLPFVDYVLKGEYEYSSLKMIKSQKKGIYESKGVTDLDSLPYPYRSKEYINLYRDYCCKKNLAFPQLWVYGGRGCAFNCDFCLWVHTMYGKRYTLRKPENILTEVENMLRKHNFKNVIFDDDCWNLGGSERLYTIAEGMKKFKVPWSVMGRLDTCSKETFKYLVDRGCTGFRLGVESLSQHLLNKTNKRLKVNQILETIDYLKKLDVSIFLCFVHNILGETQADRDIQDQKIKEINLPFQNPPCIPFPGTPYYQTVKSKNPSLAKLVSWSEYDGGKIGKNLETIVKEYSGK